MDEINKMTEEEEKDFKKVSEARKVVDEYIQKYIFALPKGIIDKWKYVRDFIGGPMNY